jgi:hypothetical protein
MTKVDRHRTYSMTPEWRIIADALADNSSPSSRKVSKVRFQACKRRGGRSYAQEE